MKTLAGLFIMVIFISGCSLFYDAPRTDAAYGQAQTKAWDNQVAFTDYRYAKKTPEGLGGIPAEQIMKVYNQSFGEKPEKEEVFNLGITEGSSM